MANNSENGTTQSETIEKAANPDDYAIVIGINNYPQITPLQSATSDATAFANWLRSKTGGGLPEEHIHLILSTDEPVDNISRAAPKKDDIDEALIKIGFLKDDAKIGRRFYFYFSGHGVGPMFDEVAMLMANSSLRLLNNNLGLRLFRSLFRDFSPARFDEIVFILDCCRDPVRTGFILAPPACYPGSTTKRKPPKSIQDFVIMAAPYGDKAFEAVTTANGSNKRTGLLTQALLEGLTNPEAADEKGYFTANSLRAYISKRVPQLATDSKLKQEPDIPFLPKKDIIFGKVSLIKVPVQIIAPLDVKGNLIIRDGNNSVIAEKSAEKATTKQPWIVKLEKNKQYSIQLEETDFVLLIDMKKLKSAPYVFKFPKFA